MKDRADCVGGRRSKQDELLNDYYIGIDLSPWLAKVGLAYLRVIGYSY